MKAVNIAALKARLSAYLDEVRRGEEILVRDRRTPIARIVPLATGGLEEDEKALAAAGILRPPQARFDRKFWAVAAPKVRLERAVRAVSADREE